MSAGSPSPLRSIRAKCLDCCGGNRAEVRRCRIEDCPLWQFRSGHNPGRAGIGGNPQLKREFPMSEQENEVAVEQPESWLSEGPMSSSAG